MIFLFSARAILQLQSQVNCIVCMSERRTYATVSCRHLSSCEACVTQLMFSSNRSLRRCPVCRQQLDSMSDWMQIYLWLCTYIYTNYFGWIKVGIGLTFLLLLFFFLILPVDYFLKNIGGKMDYKLIAKRAIYRLFTIPILFIIFWFTFPQLHFIMQLHRKRGICWRRWCSYFYLFFVLKFKLFYFQLTFIICIILFCYLTLIIIIGDEKSLNKVWSAREKQHELKIFFPKGDF